MEDCNGFKKIVLMYDIENRWMKEFIEMTNCMNDTSFSGLIIPRLNWWMKDSQVE